MLTGVDVQHITFYARLSYIIFIKLFSVVNDVCIELWQVS